MQYLIGDIMAKIMIDMFSGLGGASQAFINDEYNWYVWRLDNNPLLEDIKNTQITNDMFKTLKCWNLTKSDKTYRPELIWASPPCREFSSGFNSPSSKMQRGEEGFENFTPDQGLVKQTIDIIQQINPKYWVIENVIGSIKWLKPILGEPTQIIGSVVLWGNFPFLHMPIGFKENKEDKDVWSTDPLRANKKAKIPYEISMSLKITIEEQRQLTEWI
mgnify:CR=1 FL=1|tara:strand:+ start:419 stop:1069 length:651 start_codon:yes stop_codon:yes gene_type:complete